MPVDQSCVNRKFTYIRYVSAMVTGSLHTFNMCQCGKKDFTYIRYVSVWKKGFYIHSVCVSVEKRILHTFDMCQLW